MDALNAVSEFEISEKKSEDPSIGDIVIASQPDEFSKLLFVLNFVDQYATNSPGLVNIFLNEKDQYTVFAPTDAAFDKLIGAVGLEFIQANPDYILDVLLYHVTDGRRAANSVVPKNGVREITTLLPGYSFGVNENATINSATIDPDAVATINTSEEGATYNISANNGIIHVIDEVLIPYLP
jgi:uncharacterized surface protein with fasciclin (FAS1) repeats